MRRKERVNVTATTEPGEGKEKEGKEGRRMTTGARDQSIGSYFILSAYETIRQ